MIRLITSGRLESLVKESHKARLRAAEVRAQADRSLVARLHEAWDLTARAEAAESEAAKLRRALEEMSATVTVWLLLHYGQPHSIHRSAKDAQLEAARNGAPRDSWGPASDRPSCDVDWRTVPVMLEEGHDEFLPS